MINFGDYDEFVNSNENVIGEGTHNIVWSDSPEYVYKVDKSTRENLDETLINKKNSTGIFAKTELVGYMTSEHGKHPVYKQKRYKTIEDYVDEQLSKQGWKKIEKWRYIRDNVIITDVRPCNIALDENKDIIIIDMNLHEKVQLQ